MSAFDDDFADDDAGGASPLTDPLGVLERRWKFMAGALVLGVVASVGFSLRSRPTYLAEATVLVAPQQISERIVEPTIQAILSAARTGNVGDGKIFVQPLDRVVRIRTGELDNEALTPITADEVQRRAREARVVHAV